jgi:hypothetical protein
MRPASRRRSQQVKIKIKVKIEVKIKATSKPSAVAPVAGNRIAVNVGRILALAQFP